MVMIRNGLYSKQLKDSNSAVIFNLLAVTRQNFPKTQKLLVQLNSHSTVLYVWENKAVEQWRRVKPRKEWSRGPSRNVTCLSQLSRVLTWASNITLSECSKPQRRPTLSDEPEQAGGDFLLTARLATGVHLRAGWEDTARFALCGRGERADAGWFDRRRACVDRVRETRKLFSDRWHTRQRVLDTGSFYIMTYCIPYFTHVQCFADQDRTSADGVAQNPVLRCKSMRETILQCCRRNKTSLKYQLSCRRKTSVNSDRE